MSWFGAPHSPSYGDTKVSAAAADHKGWVLLDGRAKSALSPTQQARAATVFASTGANLPDSKDRALVGASGTKPLSSIGGAASATLSRNNLPNVVLTGTANGASGGTPAGAVRANVYAGASGDGYDPDVNNGTSNFQMTDRLPESLAYTGSGLGFTGTALGNHAHTLTVESLNSGAVAPIGLQGPYLAQNIFTYLGY